MVVRNAIKSAELSVLSIMIMAALFYSAPAHSEQNYDVTLAKKIATHVGKKLGGLRAGFALECPRFSPNRKSSPDLCFVPLAYGEPVSTSPENAPEKKPVLVKIEDIKSKKIADTLAQDGMKLIRPIGFYSTTFPGEVDTGSPSKNTTGFYPDRIPDTNLTYARYKPARVRIVYNGIIIHD